MIIESNSNYDNDNITKNILHKSPEDNYPKNGNNTYY